MQNSKHENSYHQQILEAAYQSLDPFLKITEVERITSKSKSAINRDVADRTFPAPYLIGKRAIAWKTSHIAKWMDELETTVSMEG
jgi:predicted DNA-binding transcriptional regulator AlpA